MGQKITKLLGIGLVTIGVLSLSACGAQKHADSASTSSQSSSTSSKTSSTASSQAPKKSASHQVSSKKIRNNQRAQQYQALIWLKFNKVTLVAYKGNGN